MSSFRFGILALLLAAGLIASNAQASMLFTVTLDGPSESPANSSPGTGSALITFDDVLKTMRIEVTFKDLVGNVSVAHIHAATSVPLTGLAGVATQVPTFVGFPSGVTEGSYDQTFDMTLESSYRPQFIAANGGTTASAFVALVTASVEQKAYLNIHSTQFPGGEIRGFLIAVPEPSGITLVGLSLFGSMIHRRRRR